MTSLPSQSVLDAAQAARTAPQSDKLAKLKDAAAQARDLALSINDLEEQLKQAKANLNQLYQQSLPDLMDAAGVDHIGLKQDGNLPAMDFKLRPFYAANIAASWPEEKKQEAFDLLARFNAEDLIKAQVIASLPKGDLKLAEQLVALAKKLKIKTDLKKAVSSQTLTAWLRELVEKHHTILPAVDLEKIGATIGRIVRPVERKE